MQKSHLRQVIAVVNILIAEDDNDVRLSLIDVFKMDPDIHVVGEATNGLDAIKLAKSLLPDLVLMDIRLPKLDGLEAAKLIKAFSHTNEIDIKILILSTFYDDDYVLKAQEYGVDGYLLKNLAFNKLATAIKNTCSGLVTLDRVIFEKKSALSASDTNARSMLDFLSKTELNILKLIVSGKKNSEIASILFLSEGTIRNYISNMMSKLECKSSRDLIVFGIKAGL